MRVFLTLSLAFFLLFLPLATASGGEKASSKDYHRVHGDIASLDATAQTFTLKHGGDTATFKIDANTKFRGAGKEIAFSDLRVGDDVRVLFIENGADKIAARVDVARWGSGKGGTDDPGIPCKVGYHRCGHGDCCKD